tara:strand:- start:118 stop:486 length:369 start_codon:yes stop_codon:yes gene_type:complete
MTKAFLEKMLMGGAKKRKKVKKNKGGALPDVPNDIVNKIITQLSGQGQTGGKKRKDKKKNDTGKKKTKKGKYKEFLDKKYSKEQLLKKCKELNVKVTTRKKGNIKPIKKETLINKILKLKFS